MLLFSFAFLALMIAGYCFFKKDSKVVPVIVTGVLAAILVCAFKTLFLFSHRVVPYSFAENYIYLVFRQALLPVIVLYGVFIAFSKDTCDYKSEAYFPLELSFFSIFLPHVIVSSSEGLYSGFALFVKPVLFGFMLIQTGILVKWFYSSLKKKSVVCMILFVLCALIYMCMPALFETMALLKINTVLMAAGIVIYCAIPVGLIFLTALKKLNF